jgi:hypothetical protein
MESSALIEKVAQNNVGGSTDYAARAVGRTAFRAARFFFVGCLVGCGVNVVPNNDDGLGGEDVTTTANGATGGVGGMGSGASDTTVGPTSSSSGGSGGSGGADLDANGSFSTSEEINLSTPVYADIYDINDDIDFYRFQGVEGQPLLIAIAAHPDGDGQSPDYIDSVVKLYDATKTQIAFNDDPFPPNGKQDSELFTVLPSTGTYYVSVEDIHRHDPSAPQPLDQPDGFYELVVGGIDPTRLVSEPAANNNSALTASEIIPRDDGGYYGLQILSGTFPPGDNVDWYRIDIPGDVVAPAGSRPMLAASFAPGTASGSGSTSELSSVELIDALTNAVIARVNPAAETGDKASRDWDRELYASVTAGSAYFLKVTREGSGGANDFYFFTRFSPDLDSNPLETMELANNLSSSAETIPMIDYGSYRYGFIQGELDQSGTPDVDYFRIDTGGYPKFGVFCSAQDSGSGLRGFRVTTYRSNGTTLVANGSATEAQDSAVSIFGADGIPIPPGETSLVVKMEAASGDPVVTSRTYHCGLAVF